MSPEVKSGTVEQPEALARERARMLERIGGRDATLQRLEKLAYWLDDRFRLPGTNIRIGLDGLVGLIPGVGDTATTVLSAYIILEAWRMGMPTSQIIRMIGNTGIDAVIGAIPLVGDLFDVGFKANRRNIHKVLQHHGRTAIAAGPTPTHKLPRA